MELRHLRYFAATAEAGTVSAAAQRLHVTQPGLSRQLRALEHELGVDLFDRGGGRLHLSAAGAALLPRVREVLEGADALRAAADFHARGHLARLTVAAPAVTLTDIVAPFVATLTTTDPVAAVVESDALDPVAALHRGADLAIGTVRPQDPHRSCALAALPVSASVPVTHPWAGLGSVALDELAAAPVVVLPAATTSRQAFDAALAAAGLAATHRLEAATGTMAQALAASGRGVAVVSDDPRFDLVPLAVRTPEGPLTIRLRTVWDGRHAAADLLEDFAQRLGRSARERYDVPED